MVGLPDLVAAPLEVVEDRAEELVQIREAPHVKAAPEAAILELLPHHPLGEEVDEGVGLRVNVVPVEQHLGVVEHLAEPPHQRLGGGGEGLVGAERVEVDAVGPVGREVVDVAERLRRHAKPGVEPAVLFPQLGRLVEEAEVGTLHVEADRGDPSLSGGEPLEDAGEQELDRAGLGGEAGDAGDVEVRRLRAEEEIGVGVDRRFEAPRGVDADRNPGRGGAAGVRVHPERAHDVGVASQVDGLERDRLQRLPGHLPEHRGGVEPELGGAAGTGGGGGIAAGAPRRLHRRFEVGPGEPVRDHAEDGPPRGGDPHDGADPHRRVARRPEVELVRRARPLFGGDHAAHRLRRAHPLRPGHCEGPEAPKQSRRIASAQWASR